MKKPPIKVTFLAPVPPITNTLYRIVDGRPYLTPEGKAYRKEIHSIMMERLVRPTRNGVEVEINWHRRAKRGDLDGRFKVLLDGMQSKHASWHKCPCGETFGAYKDDKQVQKITAEIFDIKDQDSYVEVTVRVRGDD